MESVSTIKATFCAVLILILCLYASLPAKAYDRDTHFLLTYYIARQVGYSKTQAAEIADADVSVDIDPNTEPFQVQLKFSRLLAGPRVRCNYHAFYDLTLPADQRERAKLDRQSDLYNEALESANPGMYLHFMQDTYAHRDPSGKPYGDLIGHLLAGHTPDYLSNDPDRARAMAYNTFNDLARYMHDLLHQQPQAMNKASIDYAVAALVDANLPDKDNPPNLTLAGLALSKAWIEKSGGESLPTIDAYHFSRDGADGTYRTPVDSQGVPVRLIVEAQAAR